MSEKTLGYIVMCIGEPTRELARAEEDTLRLASDCNGVATMFPSRRDAERAIRRDMPRCGLDFHNFEIVKLIAPPKVKP